ncbi:MAG: tyrosine-protein phosphatase [Ruminococcaceae bacterium]|nr:tyrosine-protein phosphatase [Oscillospiraceae bacterium]
MNIRIVFPEKNACLSFQTDNQKRFVAADLEERLAFVDRSLKYESLNGEGVDRSQPEPHRMQWTAVDGADSYCAEFIRPDGKVTALRSEDTSVLMPYLFTGCPYICRVTAYKNGAVIAVSEDLPFTTADEQPRFVRGLNATNIRDLGGWKTKNGRRVAQGKMFRGTEIDDNFPLTEDSIRALTEELFLKSDFDLREETPTDDPGPLAAYGVTRVAAPLDSYCEFVDRNKDQALPLLKKLCDPSIYPLYFHCWAGADRTGTLAYLILGYLGVSEDDVVLDYEATTLSVWGERSRNYPHFIKLREFMRSEYGADGADLQTQVRRFFVETGLTEEDLASFESIMLTD